MLSDNESLDFAVIMRRTDATTLTLYSPGLDAHGTEATISFLLENWKILKKFAFYYLVGMHKAPVSRVTKVLTRAREVKRSSLLRFSSESELQSL